MRQQLEPLGHLRGPRGWLLASPLVEVGRDLVWLSLTAAGCPRVAVVCFL